MKQSMKQMRNMDENQAKSMASKMQAGNYQGMPGMGQPKVKKGKGKNKGAFRF